MTPDPHERLAFASIRDLRDLLARREVSAVELATLCLDRLERIGRSHNAVATVLRQRAINEAIAADRRIARGGLHSLTGIPYGVKDLLAARGGVTTCGAWELADQLLDYDSTVVERLRRSGAVLTSKLAMMAYAGFGSRDPRASLQGPCLNPWNATRWAGGSSGGSAAAVATGLVPFALGSESAGSIAAPSAWCGVTGLRPTYGLVSRSGAMPLAWSVDKIGVFARSADDCSLVLEQIAGPDSQDPQSSGRRYRHQDAERLRHEGLERLRMGIASSDFRDTAPAGARGALALALTAFRDLCPNTVEAELPAALPYRESLDTIILAEASTAIGPIIRRRAPEQTPKVREVLRTAERIRASEYLSAQRIRRRVQQAYHDMFQGADFVLAPNFVHPWPIPTIDRDMEPVPIFGGNSATVYASNLAGLPAIFLPCGQGDDGLPVSIQLVGPPFSEARLVAFGTLYQEHTTWHRARPPVS